MSVSLDRLAVKSKISTNECLLKGYHIVTQMSLGRFAPGRSTSLRFAQGSALAPPLRATTPLPPGRGGRSRGGRLSTVGIPRPKGTLFVSQKLRVLV